MCIGIPMQVLRSEGTQAWCRGRAGTMPIDLSLVGPQPAGTWLLAFAGAAREVLESSAAARIDAALDALDAVLAGDASLVEAAFADLTSREPELPAHLRPTGS